MIKIKRLWQNFIHELSNNKLFYLIIFIVFLIILFTYRHYGISWDEFSERERGIDGYRYYTTLGKDQSYFSLFKVDYITRSPIIGSLIELLIKLIHKDTYEVYHFFLALFSLIALYFMYKILNLLLRNKLVANIGVLLLTLTPRFYGDIFNNDKDIPVLYFLLIFIYLSLKIMKKNDNKISYILLGIILAIGTGLRLLFFYVYILFFTFNVLKAVIFNKNKLNNIILKHILLIITFIISIHLINPYLQKKPILGLLDIINISQNYPWRGQVLFEGKMIRSFNLPWYYLPKWVLISTPIITLFFMFSGIYFIASSLLNTNQLKKKFSLIYMLLILFFPFLLIIFKKPVVYDAWRHFLFLIAPITIIAIYGFYCLIGLKNQYIKLLAITLLIINLITTSITMIKLHPYQYVYFNELIGSMKNADGQYEIDYWGKSFKEAIEWLKENKLKNVKRIVNVNTCSFTHYTAYYFSSNMKRVEDLNNAEYFICFNRSRLDKIVSDDKTIHIIEREGLPLNYIKKM